MYLAGNIGPDVDIYGLDWFEPNVPVQFGPNVPTHVGTKMKHSPKSDISVRPL